MHLTGDRLRSSPTDLANFLACRHKTWLDQQAAQGTIARPTWDDPLAVVLRQRGQDHERAYVDRLRAARLRVIDLTVPEGTPRPSAADAVAATLAAMCDGPDVIVQAAIGADGWFGYADVLRRVEGSSVLGDWHYEAHDTKLSAETKGGTILQLCVYTDLLGALQQRVPDRFVVVTPEAAHVYRYQDFAAFYRLAKAQYQAFLVAPVDVYPNPTEHCEVCAWWDQCNARRRKDDHLTFVAGLGRMQQTELESRDVPTLARLATVPLPLPFKPKRGARETYERLREQARLQEQQRREDRPVYELLPVERAFGLCRLPEPSPGDLFLDLEGDPYVTSADAGPGFTGGREYLFGLGWVGPDGQFVYRAWWATTEQDEREAFDALVSVMMTAVANDPGAHIYHFAPYEPSAMKRLMGRYAIRDTDIDTLLRGGRFVDLLAVVREGLRAGVESYSIKQLEQFYGFTRDVELHRAGDQRRIVELALETGDLTGVTDEVRAAVEGYNRDDVRSTLELRVWLEARRHDLVANGTDVPRFVSEAGDASESVTERDRAAAELRGRLLRLVPETGPVSATDHAIWRMAYLLDWHRREERIEWGDYHRVRAKSEEDLEDEPAALVKLVFVERVFTPPLKGRSKRVIDRYQFPPQEVDIRKDHELRLQDDTVFGSVDAIDRRAGTVDVKKVVAMTDAHPARVIAIHIVRAPEQEKALARIAGRVAESGLDDEGGDRLVNDLLLGRPPRLKTGEFTREGESPADCAVRVAGTLDDSLLAIQGPPGAGKTFTGARMIRALVGAGRRVGVVATGHKVIRKLIADAVAGSRHAGSPLPAAHKGDEEKFDEGEDGVETLKDNADAVHWLEEHAAGVLGGTAWLWARPEFEKSVDVLFVDEAGQMSLANVLAVSQAASSLVLLGDPQQLEQPQKGSHPDGVGVSALQHVLGEHQTMPVDRGIFLPETWRLAPAICRFTSEAFYEGKLHSKPGLEVQEIVGSSRWSGAGLRVVEVAHDGCRNASDEEVDVVSGIVDELLDPSVTWVNDKGTSARMTGDDILVVGPYNAHVSRLAERLAGRGVRVGTVDKFQGQEAPVVIYSMATSRPEDAPRGMEFLYSLNRLNVATSRAKCVCILVANPRLFEPECRTPRQMQLASALCRYREMAVVTS